MRSGKEVLPQGSEVVCVTDDIRLAAAVSQAFAGTSAVAPVKFVSSSELVFTVLSPMAFVVAGVDALALVHQRVDAIVTRGDLGGVPVSTQARRGAESALAIAGSWATPTSAGHVACATVDAPKVPWFALPDDDHRLRDMVGRASSFIDVQAPISTSVVTQSASLAVEPARLPSNQHTTADGVSDGVRLISVANCSTGTGASTVAWILALAYDGFSVLIDGDFRSAGLDLWINAESHAASRWPDVVQLEESVSRRQVESALIMVSEQCVLLSHGRESVAPTWAALTSMRSGLDVGDLIVVDLSSDTSSDFANSAFAGADDIVIVVSPTVSSCAAAGKLMSRIPDSSARTVLAVRGRARELSETTMRQTLNPRHMLQLPEDRRVVRALQGRRYGAVVSQRWRQSLSSLLMREDVTRPEFVGGGRPAWRRLPRGV